VLGVLGRIDFLHGDDLDLRCRVASSPRILTLLDPGSGTRSFGIEAGSNDWRRRARNGMARGS
jgi:hypothetical protein